MEMIDLSLQDQNDLVIGVQRQAGLDFALNPPDFLIQPFIEKKSSSNIIGVSSIANLKNHRAAGVSEGGLAGVPVCYLLVAVSQIEQAGFAEIVADELETDRQAGAKSGGQ